MTVKRILLATTAVWCLMLPARDALLRASVLLFLIWEDMIGKNLSLSFLQTWQYLSLRESVIVILQVSECDPSSALSAPRNGTGGLAFCHAVSCDVPVNIKKKNLKKRAPLTVCHFTLLDLCWEVIGPFHCLQACDSQEYIVHRDRPQQPGPHSLSSEKSKESWKSTQARHLLRFFFFFFNIDTLLS